jgi:hypothetical protein
MAPGMCPDVKELLSLASTKMKSSLLSIICLSCSLNIRGISGKIKPCLIRSSGEGGISRVVVVTAGAIAVVVAGFVDGVVADVVVGIVVVWVYDCIG